jgi:prophage maintenance system killer protein
MKFPDKLDVLRAHARLIAETGGSTGIRDVELLESALAAAENRHSYEDADLAACAATYAYHLTQHTPLLMVTNGLPRQLQKHFWKAMGLNWR